jgi:hypothetical protein
MLTILHICGNLLCKVKFCFMSFWFFFCVSTQLQETLSERGSTLKLLAGDV